MLPTCVPWLAINLVKNISRLQTGLTLTEQFVLVSNKRGKEPDLAESLFNHETKTKQIA